MMELDAGLLWVFKTVRFKVADWLCEKDSEFILGGLSGSTTVRKNNVCLPYYSIEFLL